MILDDLNPDHCAAETQADLPLPELPHPADLITLAESLAGFGLHPAQREILSPTLKRALLNCSRQWGKSTIAALKAALHAHFHPAQTILIGSPSSRQSEELLLKVHGYLQKVCPQLTRTQERITLPNGSRILALPNSPDNIRGYSADLVILDEAARVSDAYFAAILPTIAARPNAVVLMMTTPAGNHGFFHQIWNDAHDQSWIRIQSPASEAKHLDQDFIQLKRRFLSQQQFEQEYECGFGPASRSLIPRESLDYSHDPTIPELEPHHPYRKHDLFFLGVDFGQRQSHSAYVLTDLVLRLTNLREPITFQPVTRPIIRIRKIGRFPLGTSYPEVIQGLKAIFNRWSPNWERVLLVCDATGPGLPATEFLQKELASARRVLPIQITSQPTRITYDSKEISKMQLVDELRFVIDGKFLVWNHAHPLADDLMKELTNFEYAETRTGLPTARAGQGNDDLVIALALAAWKTWRYRPWEFRNKLTDDYIPPDKSTGVGPIIEHRFMGF
jgi:hypothetical protein